jgi:hypothetical protein
MTDATSPTPSVPPKLFVSYSWTNPEHETWVLRLATELRESGIDVILDKWDLKEGNDAHVFMEKMVTDPEIKKVILICDKMYVDKTDGRSGGVGKEAQIISGEIYEKQDQSKFVAVIKECDDDGKPYCPVYYRSRIYVDLSDASTYSENFEQLLRWVFDQPLFRKPAIGSKPTFLTNEEESALSLATSSLQRRAADAIKNNKVHAIPATVDYFKKLSEEFQKLRLDVTAKPFDEAVTGSIDLFLPYRDQAIEIFTNLAVHLDTLESRTAVHRFFEQLIPYMSLPSDWRGSYRDWDWDNFRFIVHELFLYAVAIFIKYERFDTAAYLMTNHYYVPGLARFGHDEMPSFHTIWTYIQSFEERNRRLTLGRQSLRADLLRERCKGTGIDFRNLMQADFVLFMRSAIHGTGSEGRWGPETLLYSSEQHGAFEVFARSRSKTYFNRVKILLGIDEEKALEAVLTAFANGQLMIPRWQFTSFQPAALLGFDKLATTP